MNKNTAVLPGSFDPFTNGHADILFRALQIFETVRVAVLDNPSKKTLFSVAERKQLISKVVEKYGERVKVDSFSGLLVEYLRQNQTNIIIRGLRAITDFDYETQMALINKSLSEEVETLFLAAREEHSYISSSMVKELSSLGGDVSNLVPPVINQALINKR